MTNVTDETKPGRRYSDRVLWAASIVVLLALAIILESICLGGLYLYNAVSGHGNRGFAQNHLLTRWLVSAAPNPAPGKNFLGHLRDGDRWEEFLIPDGLLGWRLGANIAVYYSRVNQASEYLYLTDDNGFSAEANDPPVTAEKPADVYRVIVLGGSTVMGDGAPRPAQNLIGMLRELAREQGVKAADGRRLEFINAGVDGYNSAQEYLYFVSDLARFKPDLVIVYDGWNDSYMWTDSSVTKTLSPFRTQTQQNGTQRIRASYSVSGSALLTLGNLKSSLTEGHFRVAMLELPWRMLRTSASNDDVDERSETYDTHLVEHYRETHRAFLALANSQRAVAVFLQPLVGTDGRELSEEQKASWWFPELEWELENRIPFYEDARRVLAELKETTRGQRQACIADVSDSFKDTSEPVYTDTGHLSPAGNRIVAMRMLNELASCGLMAKGAP